MSESEVPREVEQRELQERMERRRKDVENKVESVHHRTHLAAMFWLTIRAITLAVVVALLVLTVFQIQKIGADLNASKMRGDDIHNIVKELQQQQNADTAGQQALPGEIRSVEVCILDMIVEASSGPGGKPLDLPLPAPAGCPKVPQVKAS